jgi:hypothetical protein
VGDQDGRKKKPEKTTVFWLYNETTSGYIREKKVAKKGLTVID